MRICDVEGFDVTPCGGTHATHTAQIELLTIQKVERYKGGTRITFEAGPRARTVLERSRDELRALAGALGCAPPEVGAIVDGLQTKLDDARAESGRMRAMFADAWADRLDRSRVDDALVVATIPGADAALLRAIIERIARGDRIVALAAPDETATAVAIAHGPDRADSAADRLRAIAERCDGRGGGRAHLAQGRLPANIDFEALVRATI